MKAGKLNCFFVVLFAIFFINDESLAVKSLENNKEDSYLSKKHESIEKKSDVKLNDSSVFSDNFSNKYNFKFFTDSIMDDFGILSINVSKLIKYLLEHFPAVQKKESDISDNLQESVFFEKSSKPLIEYVYELMKKGYYLNLNEFIQNNIPDLQYFIDIFFKNVKYDEILINFSINNSKFEIVKLKLILDKIKEIVFYQSINSQEICTGEKIYPFKFNILLSGKYDGSVFDNLKDISSHIVRIRCKNDIIEDKLLEIKTFNNLTDLDLGDVNNLSDENIKKLDWGKNFPELTSLELNCSSEKMTWNVLFFCTSLKKLRCLNLVKINGSISDENLLFLKTLENLNILSLEKMKIRKEGLVCLKELKNLKKIIFASNDILSDDINENLEYLKQDIISLGLFCYNLNEQGVKHLSKLSDLECLNLKGSNILFKDISYLLENLKNLKYIIFESYQDNKIIAKEEISELNKTYPNVEIIVN